MTTARRGWIVPVVLLAALGLSACGGGDHATAPVAPAPPAAGEARDVTTAEVVRLGGEEETSVPANVQSRARAALAARIPASVTQLPYQLGQEVPAGAVVVRLDDAALRGGLAAAEAALAAAESDFARTQRLVERQAATARELEEATSRLAGAKAQVSAARDQISYAVLRAPFAGRVSARRVSLGDVVAPGMPLIEIDGRGGLEAVATVEGGVAATLRPGARVRALVDGQRAPVDATVTAIAPAGDAATHRFEVKASLPDAEGLRAGLFARLLVPGAAREPQLRVPGSAVFERGGLTGVFAVHDGRARLRWIAAGDRRGEDVEVRAGLEAGERVVLDPAGLVDGAPVRETRAAR